MEAGLEAVLNADIGRGDARGEAREERVRGDQFRVELAECDGRLRPGPFPRFAEYLGEPDVYRNSVRSATAGAGLWNELLKGCRWRCGFIISWPYKIGLTSGGGSRVDFFCRLFSGIRFGDGALSGGAP